ncbi:MAG: radical SAM protein, partial [Kiritimatiellae bacterium]|nr:radical SAM protein [Kiritimatiellia bacterium]
PLRGALAPLVSAATEFTVELHPLDATPAKLDELAALGVNRVSMGVESLDDATLRAMGRGYTSDEAARAFARVRARFENAGVDLIVGYPRDDATWFPRLADWGLSHCSVYSLQNERGLEDVPDDDFTLDRVREAAAFLAGIGLLRYEISNYAAPGFECRHNLAVWRGEDYVGLGEGASGRIALTRTRGLKDGRMETTEVSPRRDRVERTIFRLRTREGLDAAAFPEWRKTLDRFAREGLLTRRDATYFLTERGTEVCDAILAELPF